MKYELFDRVEISHSLGELCAVVPGHHKHGSTTRVGNFDRPICRIFSKCSPLVRVPHIGPSASLRSLPDALASRCTPRLAECTDMGHQTIHISSKVL